MGFFDFLKTAKPPMNSTLANPADVGEGMFEGLVKRHNKGKYPTDLLSGQLALAQQDISYEWLFLFALDIDYSSFQALKNAPGKDILLNVFWEKLHEWRRAETLSSLPERIWLMGGELRTIEAEPEEPFASRLKRRIQMYNEAIRAPHENGPSFNVGKTFCALCGDNDIASITSVSVYFSELTIARVKFIRSLKITN